MLKVRGEEQEQLFLAARAIRKAYTNDVVSLRGVIEVTNVCRVNCDYCPMRRDNIKKNERFNMSEDDIFRMAEMIISSGIGIILIQGGEDRNILPAVEKAVRRIVSVYKDSVEIILNLGNFSKEQYIRLRDAGASSYILKHETSDSSLFQRLRYEPLEDRLNNLVVLKSIGFNVGSGLISSLPGQSIESIAEDIQIALDYNVDMFSVSPFIPAPNTPLHLSPAGDNDLALNAIACVRILRPSILIPSVSALEKNGPGGQYRGLSAGANVMTVNFTDIEHQKKYLIYGKDRFVVTKDHVKLTVEKVGMRLQHNNVPIM
ncbi:biotin synthase BioB [Chromobacterium amazonense]|uniref:Radical SAM protein n=1 Tax=Chromobacterium amazonense TaxID=1382803 RepID=A0ABU8V467_9NEIS|nr:radical SAM protein [Chromobacterium amazonense]MDQ4540676.1 radical SAM protein [Chromobacterium amazonense]